MDVGPQEVGLGRTRRAAFRTRSAYISPDFDLILQAKTKKIQMKRLGFPWIPSADSGLFNGLQRIQIKKLLFFGELSLAILN
jgi:hypothetical protein